MKHSFPVLPRGLKSSLLAAAIALVLFAVAGFFVIPPIAKPILVKKLSESLHRRVSIQGIKINPFALSATVTGVQVEEPQKPEKFASFDELYVNLELASLFKGGVVIREVRLVRPYIRVVRNKDLSYNFSDLLKPKAAGKSEPLKFSINNIQISGGGADFIDSPVNTTHRVRDLNVTVPFISNLGYYTDTFVKPSLTAVVNGMPVSFRGETKPFSNSLETSFHIDLNGLEIPYYLAYVPFKMNFSIPSGRLDTNIRVSYKQFKGGQPPELNVSGDLSLRKLRVNDTQGLTVVNIPDLDVSIMSTELLTRRVHLAGIKLDSPGIDVVRDKNGRINLLSLLPEGEKRPAASEEKKGQAPLSLDVDMVTVSGGRISFSDYEGGKTFHTVLKPVDLYVNNFSTVKDWKTALDLRFSTDAAETVRIISGIQLDPLRLAGRVGLGGIQLRRYAPYYKDMITFDVEDGIASLATGFRYSADKSAPEMMVFDMSVSLSSARLKKRDERSEFLKVPVLRMDGSAIDLVQRKAVVGSVYTEDGFVNIIRDKAGVMNLLKLVRQGRKAGTKPARPAPREKEWAVTVKDAEAKSWTLRMEDHWPPETAVLVADRLNIKAQNIDTAPGTKGALAISFRPNRKGSFEASGAIGINPVSIDMKTDLENVEVTSMQPYFTDKVNVLITDGRISTKGNIAVSYAPASGYRVRYAGDMAVNGFSTVDKQYGDDFLKWKSLGITGIDIGYNPIFVNVRNVAMSGLYSRFIINKDGTFNVLKVTEMGPAEAAAPGKEKPAPAATPATPGKKLSYTARVGAITLKGGRINFTDRHIKPSYSADLSEVGGKVTGLSSEETKIGNMELKAMFGQSPIAITGSINPLRKDLYVDLKASVARLDLGQFTPYSGKYVGYTVQKGQLSLDLQYLVDKKKLEAKNNIFADQFYLGDKVESPDATKLPVKLALALLRDRRGEIHLDVPLSGSIDDPKFSLGKIVIHVILNVITKAVTSPFALLGSLVGGGEELGYVVFDYGGEAISPENAKKLDALAKAMYERPALRLNIEGHADPQKDAEAVRQQVFQQQVKAQKLKDMVSEGQPAVPVADVTVAPDEYEKYLKKAYKAAKFKKPRNIIGLAKSLPAPEMEKLMLENIQVTDDDLRQLASGRAEAVRKYLLGTGKMEPGRVFVVQPKSLAPEQKEGVKDSRVVFALE